jgi:hypothetical protein
MPECTICLKAIKTKKSLTLINKKYFTKCNCQYYYHYRCLSNWLKRKNICPICKNRLYDNRNNFLIVQVQSQWDELKDIIYKIFMLIGIHYLNFCIFMTKPFMYFVGGLLVIGLPTAIFLKIHMIYYP